MAYADELLKKQYQSNIVIQILGQYYAAYQPDSGLSVPASHVGIVNELVLNPTQVDLRIAATTISNYQFSLLDKNQVITAIGGAVGNVFFNTPVNIWIGRITGSFDFASYTQLPTTYVTTISYSKNSYKFTSTESTQRLKRPMFQLQVPLNITVDNTATTLTSTNDISSFPTSGTLRIDDEFITYSGVRLDTKEFLSCTRGVQNSTAVAHTAGATIFNVVIVTDNPLNILLQLLTSSGGGGSYDVLSDGAGITNTLVDISGITSLRDANFAGQQFTLFLYNIDDGMKYIEDQLLQACNVRFAASSAGLMTVVLLDQSVFGATVTTITNDTISAEPTWTVSANKVVNRISISWDYVEASGVYRRITQFDNTVSQAAYGLQATLDLTFKGILASLSGSTIVNTLGNRLLNRLASPTPEISVKTQIDKSTINVGDKVQLNTNTMPNADGTISFLQTLEVISRAINHTNGDVTFKLAFTSYWTIRQAYIAPSDLIATHSSQSVTTVATGRGAFYKVGWTYVLWNDATGLYTADAANTILSISGDIITWVNAWTTTLINGTHRIKFPDYSAATTDQHQYGFISQAGNNFADGTATYKITF